MEGKIARVKMRIAANSKLGFCILIDNAHKLCGILNIIQKNEFEYRTHNCAYTCRFPLSLSVVN